jgi:hypothetical protein
VLRPFIPSDSGIGIIDEDSGVKTAMRTSTKYRIRISKFRMSSECCLFALVPIRDLTVESLAVILFFRQVSKVPSVDHPPPSQRATAALSVTEGPGKVSIAIAVLTLVTMKVFNDVN